MFKQANFGVIIHFNEYINIYLLNKNVIIKF